MGKISRPSLLGCFLAVFTAAGCGPGTIPVAEVEGVVKLDGKPVSRVRVQFVPDAHKGTPGPVSAGATDENGRFKLICIDQRPGAVVGFHRVVINDMNVNLFKAPRHSGRRDDDERAPPPPKKQGPARKIADKYTTTNSPLEVEVKREKQEVEVDLTKGTVTHTS